MHVRRCLAGRSGSRRIEQLALLALLVGAGACASETPPAPAAAPSGPRLFFAEPQSGATVKSPVHLKFGVENFTIMPVPQGTVETSRPEMGHHHVGVDTDCLPAGTVIEKAAPWVHFGDGKDEIDMQLTPGPHKLALQIGDDQHRTIEGLCTTVSITVSE